MTAIGSVQALPARGGALGQVVSVQPLRGTGDVEGDGRQTAAVTVRPASASQAPTGTAPANPLAGPAITLIQQISSGDIPAGTPGKDPSETPGPSPDDRDGNGTADRDEPQARQTAGAPDVLSSSEQDQVRQLRDRDAAVRAEEMSHRLLAGPNGGPISYEYQAGPDGRLYAVGGSVSIRPVQGLEGMQAVANQAAISRAAMVGTSNADRAVSAGAGAAIANIFANQALASAAYQQSAQSPRPAGLSIQA